MRKSLIAAIASLASFIFITPLSSQGLLDQDNDGLSDTQERQLKTNPFDRDTDDDGLPDGWEVNGVGEGGDFIDLPALGADPRRKDVFVEMDYMVRPSSAAIEAKNKLAPSQAALDRIKQVFADAAISNPDGTTGITIHLDLDDEIPWDPLLDPYIQEFRKLKAVHFTKGRLRVNHYMIWADQYRSRYDNGGFSDGSSGISMGIPHSDFLVTLGAFNGGTGGSDDQKTGTFIHELGHNFGLRHGGCNDRDFLNSKPNHLSVMNYFHQLGGVPKGTTSSFEYQTVFTGLLRENALDEEYGIGAGPEASGYRIRYYDATGTMRTARAVGPIDWNGNGRIDKNPVSVDLNGDGNLDGAFCGQANEWDRADFAGGAIGLHGTLNDVGEQTDAVMVENVIRELTSEEAEQMTVPRQP